MSFLYLLFNEYLKIALHIELQRYIDGRFDFGSSGYNAVGHAVMPLHAALSA